MIAPAGRGRLAAVATLLAVATLVSFSPALRNDFVPFDDDRFITAEPHVATGLGAANLHWALTSLDQCNWHPLSRLLYQALAEPSGPRPLAFHAAGLALHVAAAVLFFLLLARATASVWLPAFAAGLFALHPLRVESVAWAAEVKDPLAAAFFFAAANAWLGHLRRPSAARWLAAVALCALAVAAKPTAVVFPIALLALDLWPLERMRTPREFLVRVAEKWPFIALAAIGSLLAVASQTLCGAVTNAAYPLVVRAGNAADTLVVYLGATFWPRGLAVFYPHAGRVGAGRVALACAVLAAITAIAVLARRRQPWLLPAWGWFVAALFPVLGVLQLGEQARADRFTYLPSAGLAIALAWGGAALTRGLPRRAVAAAAVCVLVALGALSYRQTLTWRDGEQLFRHAAGVTRDNWLAHAYLGAILLRQGNQDEAAPHLEEAYRIEPGFLETANGLAQLRRAQGRFAEAAELDARIVASLPQDAGAHFALGSDLEGMGNTAEALAEFETSAALNPQLAAPRSAIGRILLAQGRREEACGWLEEALRLDPDDALARSLLSEGCR